MSLLTPVSLTTQSTPVTRAASHGCFAEGANYVAGLMPQGFFHEDEGPCSHVPPARPAWLHRLWRQVRTHTPVASSTVSAPQGERRRARTRSPCAIGGGTAAQAVTDRKSGGEGKARGAQVDET